MRRLLTLTTAQLAATLLSGCTAAQSQAAPAPAAAIPAPSTPPAAAPAPTAPTAGPVVEPARSTPRCHTADLTVGVAADPGGGTAGTRYELLTFTNRGT